jgi:hypothetical protein
MEFLSNLSTMQRAAGAAIVVVILVLLLVKQRQAKASTGSATVTDTAAAAPEATPSGRGKRSKRGKGGKNASSDAPTTAKRRGSLLKGRKKSAPEPEAATSEPRAGTGRMVPRLPAASADPAGQESFPETTASEVPPIDGPLTAPEPSEGMINEPGWPTPGEVWSAPGAPAPAETADTGWASTNGVGETDDALAALTEGPAAAATGADWATDGAEAFDPATGWSADGDGATGDEDGESPWSAPEPDEFDWTAPVGADGWAGEPADDPTTEMSSAEAAWEAPEDDASTWTAPPSDEWEAAPADEAAPVATAVAAPEAPAAETGPAIDGPTDTAADEAAPAEQETTEFVWGPVDEAEEPSAGDPVHDAADGADSHDADEAARVWSLPAVEEPPFDSAGDDAEDRPAAALAPVGHDIVPAVDPIAEPLRVAAAVEFAAPIAVAEHAPAAYAAEPALPSFDPVPQAPVVAEAAPLDAQIQDEQVADDIDAPFDVTADPVSRWASMSPGGAPTAPTVDPIASWARLRPGPAAPAVAMATPVATPAVASPAPSPVAVALAPAPAPSVAWWDVPSAAESDPRRGRFALGGYALQPGHQVVSGVTFREGVVPPPSHWVIGPVVGAVAPGTLVLEVDGCLNCRPQDVAVLTDPGFAPTKDGFSLKLTALAEGPFAASGTYVIT